MQPVYEALGLSPYEVLNENYKIVCVEGIYDKYTIEMFCNLYVAIWDNDKEGREQCEKAKEYFGEEEAKKFKLLPKENKTKMRMENMFNEEDYLSIIKKLNLSEKTSYENIMLAAYHSESKKKIIDCLSEDTKQRFTKLSDIINETIK